jgi:predicted Kef-type K+ transport protein
MAIGTIGERAQGFGAATRYPVAVGAAGLCAQPETRLVGPTWPMHRAVFLNTTRAASLGPALPFSFVAVRLKLPGLVGYLLPGVATGLAMPGVVADIEIAAQLSEIDVLLLMVGVCLQVSRLRSLDLTDSGNGRGPVGWQVVEDLTMAVVLVLLAPMAALMAHYGGGLG